MQTLRVGAAAGTADTMLSAGERTDDDAWELTQLLDPPRADNELGWFAGCRVLRVLGAGGMGLVLEAEVVDAQGADRPATSRTFRQVPFQHLGPVVFQ